MSMKLFGPFKQLIPLRNLPVKGPLADSQMELIEGGGLIVNEGKIEQIGAYLELQNSLKDQKLVAEEIYFTEDVVCLPGFIDSHTHICYGGSRANDFALRNSGKSYLDIAKSGGGIWSSVLQTRQATEDELVETMLNRLDFLAKIGITTVEVKSGYGLSVQHELSMLTAIQKANQSSKLDIIATCLAAHSQPKDFEGNKQEYLSWIAAELFPQLKEKQLSNRVDVFIEETAFTPQVVQNYLTEAKQNGFDITIHADQFSVGGSKVAVEFGAVSADHLECSGNREIEVLANSDTVATVLPGASIGLGMNFAPARALLDAGACVSIASDFNPGSAPQGNLLAQASIVASYEKLSNLEILAAITFRAAHALRQKHIGTLEKGNQADFIIFPTPNYQEITYQQGRLLPNMVVKRGSILFEL